MSQAQPAPVETADSSCIARQPILTSDETVVGYEILFRETQEAQRFTSECDRATKATIDIVNVMGLDVLCDGRLAFINCTRQMLLSDYFALLSPTDVVVEIQETVPADENTILACQQLTSKGYSIALDNFVPNDPRQPLVPYARFIKIDISQVLPEPSAKLIGLHATENCRMLAQRVETREKFLIAQKAGFTRFQGYFFRHPENVRARQISASQATYLNLLMSVSAPEVDFTEVEELIKREPALCYRLLRYLNSPLLGLSSSVQSVRSALNLLGQSEMVRWVRLATTLVMGQEKCSDLVLSSLVRARFCELIAAEAKQGYPDLFLMGMMSLMDAILAMPMGLVVRELRLDPRIQAQLLGAKTGEKTSLSPIYDLMIAQEAGDWELVTQQAKQLNMSLFSVAQKSRDAMRWAH